MSEKKVLKTM